jgi:hypothetical protein
VVKHSILPNLVRYGIGSGLGYAVGSTATDLMDRSGVLSSSEHPGMLGNTTSEALRWAIPAAAIPTGAILAQNAGQKKDFMQAIRDRSSAT